ALGVRVGQLHAVDGDGGELLGRAANGHVAAFALVALDRHARDALGGLGDIVVRELAEQVGRDHVHVVGRRALLVQRQRVGIAGGAHFHGVQGDGVGGTGGAVQAHVHPYPGARRDDDLGVHAVVAEVVHGQLVDPG